MKLTITYLCILMSTFYMSAQSVMAYDDLGTLIDQCDSGTLTREDLNGMPTGANQCGTIISNDNSGGCFPAGELVDGFNITEITGGVVATFSTGSIGNTIPLIGTNDGTDNLSLNFERENITTAYFEYIINGGNTGAIIVYDTAGNNIFEIFSEAPSPNVRFVGFISDTPIGKIELIGNAFDIGPFAFGNCIENCNQQFYLSEETIEIDPGSTQTTDCVNAPNLIPLTVNQVGTLGVDAVLNKVQFNIIHSFSADLDISLISPSGTELVLVEDQGGSTTDAYDFTSFSDDNLDITQETPPFQGFYAPQGGRLDTAFYGESITGTWNLKICDDSNEDTGFIDFFELDFCAQEILSINEVAANIELGVYPNPTADFVNVTSSEVIDQITVYNLLGQELMKLEGSSNQLKIDLSSQPSGVYIAMIESGSRSNSVKIAKN